MIIPSEIDTSDHFWNSELQDAHKEVAARNITLLSQALAFDKDDDRWHAFNMGDYEAFRGQGVAPVGTRELGALWAFQEGGYLEITADNRYVVTGKFLGIVAKFAKPENVEQVIAR